jgi:hypothetical protein
MTRRIRARQGVAAREQLYAAAFPNPPWNGGVGRDEVFLPEVEIRFLPKAWAWSE